MGNGIDVTRVFEQKNLMENKSAINSGNVIDSGNTTYNINIFNGRKGHKPHGGRMPIGPNGRPGPFQHCHCHEHKGPDKTTQRLNAIFGGIAGILGVGLRPLNNMIDQIGNQNGCMNYMW